MWLDLQRWFVQVFELTYNPTSKNALASPFSIFTVRNSIFISLANSRTRVFEEDIHSVVDARTDSLQALRELGPPDLVHLIKQPSKSGGKQVREGSVACAL